MSIIINSNIELDEKDYYNNLTRQFAQFFVNNFSFSSNLSSNAYSKWTSIAINENNGAMIGIADDSSSTSTNNILYSYNGGLTWSSTNITSNSSNTVNWTSIAFGNNKYVAVGHYVLNKNYVLVLNESASVLTEIKNGNNGTQQNNWNSIIYAAGIFIAVAETGASRLMYSSDGVNWTIKIIQLRTWKKICYGKGVFLIASVDSNKKIMYSLDNGNTWETANIDTYASNAYEPYIVFCSKINKFIFSFYYSNDNKNYIYTSENGIDWIKTLEFSSIDVGIVKSSVWSQELELVIISYYTSSNTLNFIFSRDGVNFFFEKSALSFSFATNPEMVWNRKFSNFILVNNSADSKCILSTKILGINNLIEKNKYYSTDFFTNFIYSNNNVKTNKLEYFFIYPILNITNENISYSVSPALPSGVTLNTNNGIISGAYDLDSYFNESEFIVIANDEINNQKLKTKISLEFFNISYPITIFYYNNNQEVNLILNENGLNTYAPVIIGSSRITYDFISNPSPSNFSINSNTGIISITPLQVGTFSLLISASNSVNSITTNLSVIIKNKPPGGFTYNINNIINLLVNQTQTYIPSANSAAGLTYSTSTNIATLPGSSINSSTGVLTIVTPSTPISVTFQVKISNESGINSTTVTVNVKNPEITNFSYSPNSLSTLTYPGVNSTFTPSYSTGANLSFSSTALPTGLSLNSVNGIITGQPVSSFVDTTNVTVSSTGVVSKSFTISFNIRVNVSTMSVGGYTYQNPIVNRGGGYNISATIGYISGSIGSISDTKFNDGSIIQLYSISGSTTSNPSFPNGFYSTLIITGSNYNNWTFFRVTGNNGVSKTFYRTSANYASGGEFNWSGGLSDSWSAYYPNINYGGVTSLSIYIE